MISSVPSLACVLLLMRYLRRVIGLSRYLRHEWNASFRRKQSCGRIEPAQRKDWLPSHRIDSAGSMEAAGDFDVPTPLHENMVAGVPPVFEGLTKQLDKIVEQPLLGPKTNFPAG